MARASGLFISFEGADGVGKTTQVQKLADYLAQNSMDFIQTKEPGGTAFGLKIREILLTQQEYQIAPIESLLCLLAARHKHYHDTIKPALNANKIVICDRFIDSTYAYQSFGEGLDWDIITKLSNIVMGEVMPDITILLVNDTDNLARAIRPDNQEIRFELMGTDFQARVRQGFLYCAQKFPQRIITINANQNIQAVHCDILKNLQNTL